MIPFYIFYSMFGFQRTGDEFWAFGDARGRGFLLGATAGRTTLNGEGLQHEDGHSLVLASVIPSDPRLRPGVRLRDGGRSSATASSACTATNPQDVFYYLTLYNENYAMPARPEWVTDEDIVRGLYRFKPAPDGVGDDGPGADRAPRSWPAARSCSRRCARRRSSPSAASRPRCGARCRTSCCATRRSRPSAGTGCIPDEAAARAARHAAAARAGRAGPIVAVSDYITAWPDLIARWVPGGWWRTLGTDGFGRSDTREALRRFFEIDAEHDRRDDARRAGALRPDRPRDARRQIEELGIDPEAPFALHS